MLLPQYILQISSSLIKVSLRSLLLWPFPLSYIINLSLPKESFSQYKCAVLSPIFTLPLLYNPSCYPPISPHLFIDQFLKIVLQMLLLHFH